MKAKIAYLAVLIFSLSVFVRAADRAVLVHNTTEEINRCEGKLNLKLVRTWGGDEEEDDHKIFKSPGYVVVDEQHNYYITDMYRHHVKVFDASGKYLRTIGRKGRGPGDLFEPYRIAMTPGGDLVVKEGMMRRIQYFSPIGKSKRIRKLKNLVSWFGFTSDNQLVLHGLKTTHYSRKLVYILNDKGKTVKKIGDYHDTAQDYIDSERLIVAMDHNDTIIVANTRAPVIRKFSLDGTMTHAITYDTPFEYPTKVKLTPEGDDIEIINPYVRGGVKTKTKFNGKAVMIQKVQTQEIFDAVGGRIGVDSEDRIYLLALKRPRTIEDIENTPYGVDTFNGFKVIDNGSPLDKEMDFLRILVFTPEGKVIAEAPVTKILDDMIVSGNRLFIADMRVNKRILEYEIELKNTL